MIYRFSLLALCLYCSLFWSACSNSNTPKPTGYFRISLPEKNYVPVSASVPFYSLIPDYSCLSEINDTVKNSMWYNWEFKSMNAIVHLTYQKIDRPLYIYIEDAHKFAYNHVQVASSIRTTSINMRESKVYGLFYEIRGNETASPLQFYVSDSSNHFLRGALYFNNAPNNDSVAPVIAFIEKDINYFISNISWNNNYLLKP